MAADPTKRNNEIVLPLGRYVFVQDGTSGKIKTHVGPCVVNLSGTDMPVRYEKGDKGQGRFVQCDDPERAIQNSHVVPEGFYAVLMNPASDTRNNDGHPQESVPSTTPELKVGHKVVIQGPKMFALWPGQYAKVIRGHSLKSNEYVLGRVYNEKEARTNWAKATVIAKAEEPKPEGVVTTGETDPTPEAKAPPKDQTQEPKKAAVKGGLTMPGDMTVGTILVIKGTDVSFYIPPTGISVVPYQKERTEDEENTSLSSYIRSAVSLEQLEYCILVDEKGTKRIPRGPNVIFPLPTETFVRSKKGETKYRAIELNKIQGIHLKITKDYQDEVLGKSFKEGEEIFLTGDQCPIYFPREEHALIRYDVGSPKHYGIAIPSGEGRYIMDRSSGDVSVMHGPAMLLPNPIDKVVVSRALSPKECTWWYPGNTEALMHNLELSERTKKAAAAALATKDAAKGPDRGVRTRGMTLSADRGEDLKSANLMQAMYSSAANFAPSAQSMLDADGSASAAGDELSRSTTYTPPRTITLNTKFEGVPRITIWTGYAVMIVNSKGERRVEVGPKTVLLEYDETLEILYLSTGKPKNTDKLLETPYLRVMNNKVSDVLIVETRDHVNISLKVSYHIDFTGDSNQWWNIQNYVKHACDHMRSAIKDAVRHRPIEEFYDTVLDLLKRVVLGMDGSGTTFEQNGMQVVDVELLEVVLQDRTIQDMILRNQREAVGRSIIMSDKRAQLKATEEIEQIKQQEAELITATEIAAYQLTSEKLEAKKALDLANLAIQLEVLIERVMLVSKQEEETNVKFAAQADRDLRTARAEIAEASERQALELQHIAAEADALVKKFSSMQAGMSEALLAISNNDTLIKVAEAGSVQNLIGGSNAVEVLSNMFAGTGLAEIVGALLNRQRQLPVLQEKTTAGK